MSSTIPTPLLDPTTLVSGHTIWTHMPCLLLRTGIALSILTGRMSSTTVQLLSLATVVVFGSKFFSLPNVWKVYLRTVFVYAIVLGLFFFYGDKYRTVSATLIMVDVLMAIQSRHIFNQIGKLMGGH